MKGIAAGKHVGRTLILGLAVLVAGGGCSTNVSTGRSQFILVSPEEMSAMGAAAMPELVQSYGGQVRSGSLSSYVTGVGSTMADLTEADFPLLDWQFTVLDSDVINAFALPGGKVFISRGLLVRLDDEAEMAGVIGHEIGHVTARHVDERVSQSIALEWGVAVVTASTDSQLAQMAGSLFGQGYLLKFGREQELEADRQGLKYMTYAGYDPSAMRDVMQVLKTATQGGGQPPEFLSTHPLPETRIEAIDEALATEYAQAVGNPSYRRYRNRFDGQIRPVLGTASAGSLDGAWCAVCSARADAAGLDTAE